MEAPQESHPQRLSNRKPDAVQAIAIMTLVNGILNIIWALILTVSVVFGTFLLGLVCVPLTLIPAVLGIFEILYAIKLMATPPQPVKPNQTLAILEIVAIIFGNVISLIVGILALVFYNQPDVRAYFADINAP